MLGSQGVNGKVNFLEKYGTGESNGTDAYELDLSLVDNYQLAWRGLTGLRKYLQTLHNFFSFSSATLHSICLRSTMLSSG